MHWEMYLHFDILPILLNRESGQTVVEKDTVC